MQTKYARKVGACCAKVFNNANVVTKFLIICSQKSGLEIFLTENSVSEYSINLKLAVV